MNKVYCPGCKKLVNESELQQKYHSCGHRTVPVWSECMRLQYENKRLLCLLQVCSNIFEALSYKKQTADVRAQIKEALQVKEAKDGKEPV